MNGHSAGLDRLKASGLPGHPLGKNPGDVWTIPTAQNRDAFHTAVMPLELAARAIAVTCPERRCTHCHAPYRCDSEQARWIAHRLGHTSVGTLAPRPDLPLQPTCDCHADSEPGIVLDPFLGSGTTALAAQQLHRDWLGIELKADYARYARTRLVRAHHEKGADE